MVEVSAVPSPPPPSSAILTSATSHQAGQHRPSHCCPCLQVATNVLYGMFVMASDSTVATTQARHNNRIGLWAAHAVESLFLPRNCISQVPHTRRKKLHSRCLQWHLCLKSYIWQSELPWMAPLKFSDTIGANRDWWIKKQLLNKCPAQKVQVEGWRTS